MAAALMQRIPDFQVSPYMLGKPMPPAAHIYPTPVDYDLAGSRGLDEWTFTLQVFVADITTDIGPQVELDAYLNSSGPRSIKEKMEEDNTLGGLIDDLIVRRSEGYRRYMTEGRGPVLGSEWIISVYAGG